MAISVRLPDNLNGDNDSSTQQRDFVQHYLIEQHHTDVSEELTDAASEEAARIEPKSKTKMKLESSNNSFDNILSLVYHYLTVR